MTEPTVERVKEIRHQLNGYDRLSTYDRELIALCDAYILQREQKAAGFVSIYGLEALTVMGDQHKDDPEWNSYTSLWHHHTGEDRIPMVPLYTAPPSDPLRARCATVTDAMADALRHEFTRMCAEFDPSTFRVMDRVAAKRLLAATLREDKT